MEFKMIKYVLGFLVLFSSCYYDNEEDLFQYIETCDTTNIGFENSVQPILNAECAACHLGGNTLGNVKLDTYSDVKVYVDNGQLLDDIKGTGNMMPKSGLMSNCNIAIIEKWITDGAQNN